VAVIGMPFLVLGVPDAKGLRSLAALGAVQLGLPYVLYAWAIKRVTALDSILIPIIEPILNPLWVFLLIGERPGPWGWTLFGLIWGLAVLGIVLKIWFVGRLKGFSIALYLAMGWLVVIALKPLFAMVDHGMIVWIVIGGLCYTLGVIFYALKRMPYHHAVWHLFVLGGSTTHYLGLLFYLAAR